MPPVPRASTSARRDEILDAAVRLLREQGGKALTQSRVARAAGIPQGHLTYYFPRRADLLVAVARRSLETAASEVFAHVHRGGGDKPTDLKAAARAGVTTMIKDHQRTRMMLGLLIEAEHDEATRAVLQDNVRGLRELLGGWLGRPADDPDVEVALGALWGLGLSHFLWGESRPADETDRVLARLSHFLETLERSGRTR
jgi:AcrR family transcriptional regulator